MGKITELDDDGSGPYEYCEAGRSHCLDQNCGCVNNLTHRVVYRLARRESLLRAISVGNAAVLALLLFLGVIFL